MSQPTESKDDVEARPDFWSIQGDFIYRHHSEPRVQLYVVPKEETFPMPLRYMDITRSAHTNLDVLQEKRIDDYWKVEWQTFESSSRMQFPVFAVTFVMLLGSLLHGMAGAMGPFQFSPRVF